MKRNNILHYSLLGLLCWCGALLPHRASAAGTVWAGTYNLARWNIPAGDYSGITPVGQGLYAVVNDKRNGFSLWEIRQDSLTGRVMQVKEVRQVALQDRKTEPRLDLEAVSWWPERNCLLLMSEQKQTVLAYDLTGTPVDFRWPMPVEAAPEKIHANYGFESLTRDEARSCFWTCTENVLRAEGLPVGPLRREAASVPVFCLNDDGTARLAARYPTDVPRARTSGRAYCYGVSELLVLPGYGLLVLEREFFASRNYLRSWVNHTVYRVDPEALWTAGGKAVAKTPVATFRTRLNPLSYRLANFEGMAAGIRLADGRQTVLLLCDAQSGAGNRLFHLKDYLRVLVLPAKTQTKN